MFEGTAEQLMEIEAAAPLPRQVISADLGDPNPR